MGLGKLTVLNPSLIITYPSVRLERPRSRKSSHFAYPREPVYIMLKCFLFVECAALGKAITGFAQEVRCFLPALFDLLFAHLEDSIHFPMSSKYHDLCDTVDFLDWNHNACIRWKTVSYKDPGIVVTTSMHSHFAIGRSMLACCVYIASLPRTCIHIEIWAQT